MRSDERLLANSNDSGDPSEEYARLLSLYLDRLNNGEFVDPDQILSDHPDLGERLLSGLEAFLDIAPDEGSSPPLGTLGDYTLRRQIGHGGMGAVYEAWQGSLDRQVALKVLPAGIAADDKAFHRFMREAKTTAKLNHANIVGVHGVGIEQNTPYYAMELVEGETVAQILAKTRDVEPETETPFGPKDQVDYFAKLARAFADVADGLQHAHSKGVTHRDIKPSNLILDADGRLRILDFGLARLEGQESLTISGDVMGTPLYMSPEQARRKKIAVDHRTDVYSLGATMYEAICGRPPFRGKDHADTLSQIIERDPVEPRKINPRVPKDLETVVLKCLRKDSGDRYGTAEALGQDLRRFVRGDAIEALPRSNLDRWKGWVWSRRTQLTVISLVTLLIGTSGWIALSIHLASTRQSEAAYEGLVLSAVARIEMADQLSIAGSRDLLAFARRDLERAVDVLPGRKDAKYHLARTRVRLGQLDEAVEILDPMESEFYPAAHLAYEVRRLSGVESGKVEGPDLRAPVGWEEDWRTITFELSDYNAGQVVGACQRLLDGFSGAFTEPVVGMSLRARMIAGRACIRGGFNAMAMDCFSRVSERWPDLVEPRVLSSIAAYRLGDKHYALETLEGLYEKSEDREYTATLIALTCLNVSFAHTGLRFVDRIADAALAARLRAGFLSKFGSSRIDEASMWAKRALDLDPTSSDARFFLGVIAQQRGDLDSAIRWYLDALSIAPSDRRVVRELTAVLSKKADLDAGRAVFEELVSAQGETPLVLLYRGKFCMVMNDHQGALRDFNRLAANPEFRADGLFYRSLVHERRSDFAEAIADASSVIELSPRTGLAFFNRALFRFKTEDYEGAALDANMAIRIHPKRAMNYNLRGVSRERLKNFEDALADYNSAVALARGLEIPRLNRARLRADLGDIDGALADCAAVLKTNPDSANAIICRGRILALAGRSDEAIRDVREGLARMDSAEASTVASRWRSIAGIYSILATKTKPEQHAAGGGERAHVSLEDSVALYESKALETLERAVEEGYREARELRSARDFERLRQHPRFRRLLEEMSD